MCKYCRLVEDVAPGCKELKGGVRTLKKIDCKYFVISMDIYGTEFDDEKEFSLYLNMAAKDQEHGITSEVESKDIRIKYCPFCGEKLF